MVVLLSATALVTVALCWRELEPYLIGALR